ncbi:MAG TPA: hypothetical protein H9776_07575 [Candidatus Mediterraneibacter intestinipullorum]|nr:hypothetical protein [Candidatus Mediterraneibacter intestinipullorum]
MHFHATVFCLDDSDIYTSETVLSAYENISGLRKEDSFRSWMFAILSNCCKRMLRSGQKEMLQKDGGALPEKRQEGHEPDYAQWHDVRRALEKMRSALI